MPRSKDEFQEHLIDLLWGLWEELGVSGVVPRHHGDVFIDPEPLIVFTALHGNLDPRLRDESIDWVISYGSYVSKARIKSLRRDWSAEADSSFAAYSATVNKHADLGWPDDHRQALTFRPRARAVLKDLTAGPLISLRIRAMFGVSARAELIRVFVSRPDTTFTATELAQETNYVRRQVIRALDSLQFAGLVRPFRAGANTRYALARPNDVETIVATRPARFPHWGSIFGLFHDLLGLLEQGARSGTVEAAVAARHFIEEHGIELERNEIAIPQLPASVAAWSALQRWAIGVARSYARPATVAQQRKRPPQAAESLTGRERGGGARPRNARLPRLVPSSAAHRVAARLARLRDPDR
jgi:hypothetical protein